MKNKFNRRAWVVFCVGFLVWSACANAQNIFVDLLTGAAVPTNINITAPTGYSFSGVAPVTGSNWNTVGESSTVPLNTIVGSTVMIYSNLPLNNSAGASISATLGVSYFSKVTTGTRVQPSNASGENTIQPGGVMQQAWRNFFNGSGNFFTFTFSNLTASTLYGLYVEGGTTTSGQGAGVALSNSNVYAVSSGNPTNAVTTNTVANSNSAFGSLFTSNGAGGFQLMPRGMTWAVLYGQSDASGNFSFMFNGAGNGAYLNGFQLVPLSAPVLTGPTNLTVIAGNAGTLSASATGLPAPTFQWLENATNVVSATNATLVLPNVQYSQNAFTYSLVASNIAGVVTNTMTLTVIVTPSITGLTNQAVTVSNNVTIAASVTGVPTPALQWQLNGTNLTDGATGNGSTITGSTSSSLVINNAQTADSGNYCLIASNVAGVVTNCMTLTVSGGNVPPGIVGPVDQTVVQGNYGTFSASVSGLPTPTEQWYDNGSPIPGATGLSLILTNVQYATQDGHVYSIIASNAEGTATNSATLHVLVPPSISSQPVSLVVTATQSAAFSVTAGGVPAPTYQWYFNSSPINNATNSTYFIASATAANIGTYYVVASNNVSSATSSNATLTVNSTMAVVSLTPGSGAMGICYDTPLYIAFSQTPVINSLGKIRIYDTTNSVTPVDTLDMSQNMIVGGHTNVQSRNIGGDTYNSYPIIVSGNVAAIYPHLGVLTSNQVYYVTVDDGVFTDTSGSYFAGITDTNTWRFTTKTAGPASPTNIVVAADGSGDFCTVQGAVDFAPGNNTTYRLVNIRNGTYTEIIDIKSKNNLTFRGQDRKATVITYANNSNLNPAATQFRVMIDAQGNDLAFENLTMTNSTPKGGSQAEALRVRGLRCIVLNADLDSFQDTLLVNTTGDQVYFKNSHIQGDTDYTWGSGTAYLTNCEMLAMNNGYNCQPRTSQGVNGFAWVKCKIIGAAGVNNQYLARDGGNYGQAVYISCAIDTNVVPPAGWVLQNGSDTSTLRFWEYQSTDLTGTNLIDVSQRISWSVQLNASQAAAVTDVTNWFGGWSPQLAPNILTNPVSATVPAGVSATFTVVATGIPDPTYQWQSGGSNLVDQTSSTLTISNAHCADAGTYSVIVSNIAGAVISSNATLTVIGTTPVASFTASPASGTEPVTVTFTDTSIGSPLSLAWDFGDFTTTNSAAGAVIMHTYAAGTYTVTLTASNACDISTLVSNNVISVVTAFQAWQLEYFGCTNCPQASSSADPDGDGQNNVAEFLAGTDPNNASSYMHVLSVIRQGNDMSITWVAGGGRTNVLQATAGDISGNYFTNFSDIVTNIIAGSGDATNNYVDGGGATNGPTRYYRIRLMP